MFMDHYFYLQLLKFSKSNTWTANIFQLLVLFWVHLSLIPVVCRTQSNSKSQSLRYQYQSQKLILLYYSSLVLTSRKVNTASSEVSIEPINFDFNVAIGESSNLQTDVTTGYKIPPQVCIYIIYSKNGFYNFQQKKY